MANCDVCGGPDGRFECTGFSLYWPADVHGARYGYCCTGKAKDVMVDGIRARGGEQTPQPIGFTSSGEPTYGAGGGLVTLDGGRTHGSGYVLSALLGPPKTSDIYDKIAKACEAAISMANLPSGLVFVADAEHDVLKTGTLKGCLKESSPHRFEMTIGFTPPTINCLRCTSPATRDGYCAYCLTSSGYAGPAEQDAVMAKCSGNGGPTGRHTERALALEKPRSTATSRELAKAHPWEVWSTSGDES